MTLQLGRYRRISRTKWLPINPHPPVTQTVIESIGFIEPVIEVVEFVESLELIESSQSVGSVGSVGFIEFVASVGFLESFEFIELARSVGSVGSVGSIVSDRVGASGSPLLGTPLGPWVPRVYLRRFSPFGRCKKIGNQTAEQLC